MPWPLATDYQLAGIAGEGLGAIVEQVSNAQECSERISIGHSPGPRASTPGTSDILCT